MLLAHVGSFVPAETAVIGITDRIFTRIVSADTQSIPQSTFMADLSQVSTMLRSATAQCVRSDAYHTEVVQMKHGNMYVNTWELQRVSTQC